MADATLPANPQMASTTDSASPLVAISSNARWQDRLRHFINQPAVQRSLPAAGAFIAITLAGMAYLAIVSGPQIVAFRGLSDLERAEVSQALDSAGIAHEIDISTGAVSVAEADYRKATQTVAQNTGIHAEYNPTDMLDNIPMGASRTMEGERLRLARERDLQKSIERMVDIESARVHLATPEKSVFVRQNNPASASVIVGLRRGRSLSQAQVDGIVNIVASGVPGLVPDRVRVVDQSGRVLTAEHSSSEFDALMLQREHEAKLRDQIAQLLTPMLGEGNFSSEVQVALELSEVTSARERYDPDAVVRSENEMSASRQAGPQAGGVPGVLANTPPPPAEVVEAPPQGEGEAAPNALPIDSQRSVQKRYEVGREVAVTTAPSGGLLRLSVALSVDDEALKAAAPMTADNLQELVARAVGANPERGDVVVVMPGTFEKIEPEEVPFYEQGWFDLALRYGGAFLALLLILVMGVRPLLKRLIPPAPLYKKADQDGAGAGADAGSDAAQTSDGQYGNIGGVESGRESGRDNGEQASDAAGLSQNGDGALIEGQGNGQDEEEVIQPVIEEPELPIKIPVIKNASPAAVVAQVELARQMASTQPERTVAALQRMLSAPSEQEGEDGDEAEAAP